MFALDQSSVEIRLRKRRTGDEARQELDVVGDADDAILRQRLQHARAGPLARVVADDQLGDHRVVVRRDLVAFLDAGVDAHVQRLGRRRQMQQPAGRGQEALVRIFGVDARLDGMAANSQLLLRQRQRFARGYAQLPLDEIEAGDHLRHRMLDL